MATADVSRETFLRTLSEDLAEVSLAIESSVREQLADFYRLVVSWNRVHNLTRITDPATAATRHFAESLLPLCISGLFPLNGRCADVGSGAGFPGIPLAIARPDLAWTLIEKVQKKAAFLSYATATLGLRNITVIPADVRQVAARFPLVVSRALSSDMTGVQLLAPLGEPQGALLLYPGPQEAFAESHRFAEHRFTVRGRVIRLVVHRLAVR